MRLINVEKMERRIEKIREKMMGKEQKLEKEQKFQGEQKLGEKVTIGERRKRLIMDHTTPLTKKQNL